MLVIHWQKCQELSQPIKYMSERQEKLQEMLERRQSLLMEALDDFRKILFQELRTLDERICKEEMELLEKADPGRNVGGKEERLNGGRERERSFLVKVVSPRIAVSGSQTSEMEAELPSDDADDRGVTEDAAVAGSVLTPKAMEVSTDNEDGRKVSSVDE